MTFNKIYRASISFPELWVSHSGKSWLVVKLSYLSANSNKFGGKVLIRYCSCCLRKLYLAWRYCFVGRAECTKTQPSHKGVLFETLLCLSSNGQIHSVVDAVLLTNACGGYLLSDPRPVGHFSNLIHCDCGLGDDCLVNVGVQKRSSTFTILSTEQIENDRLSFSVWALNEKRHFKLGQVC